MRPDRAPLPRCEGRPARRRLRARRWDLAAVCLVAAPLLSGASPAQQAGSAEAKPTGGTSPKAVDKQTKAVKKQTTDSRHSFPRYENLVKELDVVRPDQVWVGEIV